MEGFSKLNEQFESTMIIKLVRSPLNENFIPFLFTLKGGLKIIDFSPLWLHTLVLIEVRPYTGPLRKLCTFFFVQHKPTQTEFIFHPHDTYHIHCGTNHSFVRPWTGKTSIKSDGSYVKPKVFLSTVESWFLYLSILTSNFSFNLLNNRKRIYILK